MGGTDEMPRDSSKDQAEEVVPKKKFLVEKFPSQLRSELRPVRSHPSMSQMPAIGVSKSRRSLKDLTGFRSRSHSREPSLASSHSSTIKESRKSVESGGQSTKRSTNNNNSPPVISDGKEYSIPAAYDDDFEEEGGHDTITSLAGGKILQQYRRAMQGSRPGSSASVDANRIDQIFKGESLEDIKESDDDDEDVDGVSTKESESIEFVPPDGGYGWWIAFGAFNALFWCAGMVKSYGVIFNKLLEFFPNSSISLASWIPACMTSLALAMAPFASALCQKYCCRYVTLTGAIICAFGIGISSLAPNIQFLFISLGIFTGVGFGLSTTPGIILTARYFEKNRAKANAFCLSGTAAGSFILPYLIECLMKEYGFRGALLILGACMLHISISAALFRPLSVHAKLNKKAIRNVHKDLLISSPKQDTPNDSKPEMKQFFHPITNKSMIANGNHDLAEDLRSRLSSLESESSYSRNSRLCLHQDWDTPLQPLHFDSLAKLNQFGSTACSLPPHLDQHSIHGSSNHSCDSLKLSGNLDAIKVDGKSNNSPQHTTSPLRQLKYSLSTFEERGGSEELAVPEIQQSKALSLRELYKHQVGSTMSVYKERLSKRFEKIREGNNTTSQESVGEEGQHKRNHRISMMFSLEDLTTDSTCILKDSTCSRRSQSKLNRSRSEAKYHVSKRKKCIQPRRPRYYSECKENPESRFSLTRLSDLDIEGSVASIDDKEAANSAKGEKNIKAQGRVMKFLNKHFDLDVIRDVNFIIVTLTAITMTFGVPHVLFFLPPQASLVQVDASLVLSISAVFDLLGRLSSGFIIDLGIIPLHVFYACAILLSGTAVLLIPLMTSQTGLILSIGLYGFGAGTWFLMVPLLLSEYLGVERIAASYGMLRFFQSGANLIGPILGGYLWDKTGNLIATFVFIGIAMTFGSVIALLQPVAQSRCKTKLEK